MNVSEAKCFTIIIDRKPLWKDSSPWGHEYVPRDVIIESVASSLGCRKAYLSRVVRYYIRNFAGAEWPCDSSFQPLPFAQIPVMLASSRFGAPPNELVIGSLRAKWPEPSSES